MPIVSVSELSSGFMRMLSEFSPAVCAIEKTILQESILARSLKTLAKPGRRPDKL
jgi:hypothetical protein